MNGNFTVSTVFTVTRLQYKFSHRDTCFPILYSFTEVRVFFINSTLVLDACINALHHQHNAD